MGLLPNLEVVFVRSEYHPGQFTGGDLDHPLANVCVPTSNIDCEWADGLDVGRASSIITKRQADAMESPDYKDLIDRFVSRGGGAVYFAGFH